MLNHYCDEMDSIFAKLCISKRFQGNIYIVFQEISGVRGCELFWGLE